MQCASKRKKPFLPWICSDPQVVQDYSDSEYCGFTFTDDAYLALFDLMKRAYDVKHWKCTKPEMPVLFVSGAEDPCMGNVRQLRRSLSVPCVVQDTGMSGENYIRECATRS